MIVASLLCLLGSALTAWLMWGPVLSFFFSLIPVNAEYAWVGKLIVIWFVAYLGGVGIPLVLLVFAGIFAFHSWAR